MSRFYLVQRATWNKDATRENASFLRFTGRDGLIDLDYMGSAEFEWGTIPKAYRRVLAEFDRYHLTRTGMRNKNGVPLWVYCREDRKAETIESIKEYIESPWRLKEWIHLQDQFKGKNTLFGAPSDNFWWAVEQGIDWMAFFGETDRAEIFTTMMNARYQDWWLEKPEKEREEEVKEAFLARY